MPSFKTYFLAHHLVGQLCLALLLCTLLAQAHPAPTSADSITYKGITLTPAVINLDLQKGQTRASFDIQVSNNTSEPQALTISSIDFRSLNETGGVAFIGSEASEFDHKYGLASWLDLGNGSVELAPGQTKTVSVAVDNRMDLSPGGHYAAVLFRSAGVSSVTGGANPVAINQVVSSLVFVRKTEGAKFSIGLEQLSVPRGWFRLPSAINVVFKNTGNIQLVPRGLITVSGPFSHEVSRGIVNTDSNLVLPGGSRLYQVNLFKTGHVWWPGIYHVRVQYRYDGSVALQTATAAFLYLDPMLIGIVLVVIAVSWYSIRKRQYIFRLLRRLPKQKR
ncbi:MAG TPA: hypothetical protein VLH84_02535 [Patescibacteria group bacterium]|nr:hypothetical protein [Patescibacteria group bacterium]